MESLVKRNWMFDLKGSISENLRAQINSLIKTPSCVLYSRYLLVIMDKMTVNKSIAITT